MNYQELYQRYKAIRWVKHSLMPEWGVRARFQKVYHAALDALHKEVFPRRKKINWDNLPEDRVAELADYYVKQAMAWYTCAVGRTCWLEHKLSTMAQDIAGRIQDHGEERLLYTSDSGTYYTQGFGTHKYTHAAAIDWADPLIEAGHKIRIEQVDRRSKGRWSCWSGEVRVWGYLDEWEIDAVKRAESKTTLEWAVDCWKQGVNPAVYAPLMSHEILEKSCEIAMGKTN